MIITENLLIKIISEEVMNALYESIELNSIGQSGPLNSELINPSELFSKELSMAKQIMSNRQRVDIDSIFKDTLAYKVYLNYYNAMTSKSGKIARGFLGWLKTICEGKLGVKIMAFREGNNFLFGYWVNNYFISAYFAPASPMGKFNIIKSISKYNNIIFPVTRDLSDMLSKLGFKKSNSAQNVRWRNRMVQKDIFGTSDAAINFGIKVLNYWNH